MYIEHGSSSPAASGRCIGICSTPSPRLEREKNLRKAILIARAGSPLQRRDLPHAPRSRPGSRPASRKSGDRGGDRSGDDGAANTKRASRSSSSAAQHQQPASFWRASGTRRCEKGTGDDQQGDGGHRKPSLSESSRPPSPTCNLEPFRRAFRNESNKSFNRSKELCSLRMSAGSLDTARLSRATSFSSRARSRSARSRSILARAAACSLASSRAASDADRAAALRASARNRSTVDASTLLLDASSAKVSQASRKPRAGAATVSAGVACRAFIFSFRARLWCCSRVDGVCGSVLTRSRLVLSQCCLWWCYSSAITAIADVCGRNGVHQILVSHRRSTGYRL